MANGLIKYSEHKSHVQWRRITNVTLFLLYPLSQYFFYTLQFWFEIILVWFVMVIVGMILKIKVLFYTFNVSGLKFLGWWVRSNYYGSNNFIGQKSHEHMPEVCVLSLVFLISKSFCMFKPTSSSSSATTNVFGFDLQFVFDGFS